MMGDHAGNFFVCWQNNAEILHFFLMLLMTLAVSLLVIPQLIRVKFLRY